MKQQLTNNTDTTADANNNDDAVSSHMSTAYHPNEPTSTINKQTRETRPGSRARARRRPGRGATGARQAAADAPPPPTKEEEEEEEEEEEDTQCSEGSVRLV